MLSVGLTEKYSRIPDGLQNKTATHNKQGHRQFAQDTTTILSGFTGFSSVFVSVDPNAFVVFSGGFTPTRPGINRILSWFEFKFTPRCKGPPFLKEAL